MLLNGPKSSFQIKVNFAFHLEIKGWSLEEDWRGAKSKLLEVRCEISEVGDDLGCRDVSWCWFIVFYQVQSQCSRLPGDFRALYASICWQALWRCWFHFPAVLYHLPTVPKPFPNALLTMILLCLIGQPKCLNWTPYGIYGIFSRERWETADPTIQTSWRLNSVSGWSRPCHSSMMLELELFCFANPFFNLGNILIFWDNDFLLSLAVSSNHKKKKTLMCFTLHVMNLKYMKVSLFEISDNFLPYSNFWDALVQLVMKERWDALLKTYHTTVYSSLYYVEHYAREMDWASVITCIWYSIHFQLNLIFTMKH